MSFPHLLGKVHWWVKIIIITQNETVLTFKLICQWSRFLTQQKKNISFQIRDKINLTRNRLRTCKKFYLVSISYGEFYWSEIQKKKKMLYRWENILHGINLFHINCDNVYPPQWWIFHKFPNSFAQHHWGRRNQQTRWEPFVNITIFQKR